MKGQSATPSQDKLSSTTTPNVPITGSRPIGRVNPPASTNSLDTYIRQTALQHLRQYKRCSVDEIYEVISRRVRDVTRDDVVNTLICMGHEGKIKIDYEPVCSLR